MEDDAKIYAEMITELGDALNYDAKFTFKSLWGDFRKTEERSLRKYRNELNAIGNQLNTLVLSIDAVKEKYGADIELLDLLMKHIGKTITSFQGAISLYVRSLYSEGANCLRVGLETAWQMFYLFDLPLERGRWNAGNKIDTKKPRIHLSYSDERWKVYDQFSQLSHPRLVGMDIYGTYRGGIKTGPATIESFLGDGLWFIHFFLGWITEDMLEKLFPETKSAKTKEDFANLPAFVKSHILDKTYMYKYFKPLKKELYGE